MTTTAPTVPSQDLDAVAVGRTGNPVGGPVTAGWREATLTRAKELEALSSWIAGRGVADGQLVDAVGIHLAATRDAAGNRRWCQLPRKAARMERAMSNLAAAEANLMQLAPAPYLLGQLPSVLNHVQRLLRPGDARR